MALPLQQSHRKFRREQLFVGLGHWAIHQCTHYNFCLQALLNKTGCLLLMGQRVNVASNVVAPAELRRRMKSLRNCCRCL
ncbi:Hypothetical predicted protein [Podarcis lilfordi]|uniref:Uncharacterized protein n=1 Tax=Podarcis lilfordi TaxID=74358 RepID=A0AA35KF28_9SAUR|nr:Hypothetical predicted protein [Podarcis lilfordi]